MLEAGSVVISSFAQLFMTLHVLTHTERVPFVVRRMFLLKWFVGLKIPLGKKQLMDFGLTMSLNPLP